MANAIFMSVLTYSMPVWSGAPGYVLTALQAVQTEVARVVTGRNWQPGGGPRRVKTRELLQQCGWMSVQQLGVHTSVMEVHRILQNKQPQYLYKKLTARTRAQGVHRTRQNYQFVEEGLVDRGLLEVSRARLDVTNKSWRWRAAGQYKQLPNMMKKLNIKECKNQFKTWVKLNV